MSKKAIMVLISPDLRTRSFLRAQLMEEGIDVAAFKSIDDARQWMYIGGRVPALIVVDVWRSAVPKPSIKWLKDISDRSPLIFLTGARERPRLDLEAMGEIIKRPVSIAEIVSRIRSRM